ncbi:MAG: PAS domain-containing sensor histidine kinase [Candidatus Aenigmarchaeota archaeon]|nr:PAS domain-containing sensor histidine kinase [Candidatus Aenigmarchaeota archaeon]
MKLNPNMWKKLFDFAPDIYYIHDEKGIFVYANKMAEKITGLTPKKLKSKEFINLGIFPDYEIKKVSYLVKSVLSGKQIGPANVDIKNVKTGKITTVEVIAKRCYCGSKKKYFVLGVARDVTTKVIAEKKLHESIKKLKELNKEKNMFLSIAAHELKTPMAAIKGFTQLLNNDELVKDKEKRSKYLKIIENEVDRLSLLVTDLLDLTRIDLGTIKFIVEDVDISEILDRVQKEMQQLAKEKKLQLSYECKNKIKIKTDREKLYEILINLVSNAIKYTEKGFVKVVAEKQGKFIKFSVIDTGIGIDKKYHKKIFERFFQVDPTYTRENKGYGLGLSVCKELVNKMGGKIWFDSEVGKGTTFYFTLPINSRVKR